MSTALAVVEPELTLEDLAAAYDREHALVLESAVQLVEHAIRAGEALRAMKERVPRGQWVDFLLERFPDRSLVTSYQYMRIAAYADKVRDTQPTSIKGAIRALAGLPSIAGEDPGTREMARQLYATGRYTYRQIAEELDCSRGSIHNWIKPRQYEAQKRAKSARTVQERRALRAQQRRRAVRSVGGDRDKAYNHVLKALQALQCAVEDQDLAPECKRILQGAMTSLYGAEDSIVRASKLS